MATLFFIKGQTLYSATGYQCDVVANNPDYNGML